MRATAKATIEWLTARYRPAASKYAEAHAYLSRLLPPDVEPEPGLLGLCTQLDNLIVGLRTQPVDSDWEHTSHYDHHDPMGTYGRNCPACQADSRNRERYRALLAALSKAESEE